jgi:hypothetical protein
MVTVFNGGGMVSGDTNEVLVVSGLSGFPKEPCKLTNSSINSF